jgi:tRNA pseudouridine38-40 synthase
VSNIRLTVTYDGTEYSGFQWQANAPTIQGKLEEALARIYGQPLRIAAAGRTDAGVHARGQVVNYQAPFPIPVERIPKAFNACLPRDIVVVAAEEVPPEFHARYSARGKKYSYTIDRAPFPQVLLRRYSYHVGEPLEIEAMAAAAALLQGKKDFAAFQARGSSAQNTVRHLFRVEVREYPREQLLRLFFHGDGFLYRMVRLMTGSLLRVGLGKLAPGDLAAALSGERPEAVGPTVPARGLCLEEVYY